MRTLIQLIKAAAVKLRDSKLKRLGGKEITAQLDMMAQRLGLDNKGEAVVFTALFDRSCAGRCSDLEDLSSYFGCTQLEVMEYVPFVKSLLEKGLVVQTDLSECRLTNQNFLVANHVIGSVLENRRPELRKSRILEKEFDRYDFCRLVDSQVQDSDVMSESLFQFVDSIERENSEMPLVRELVAVVEDLPARTLFYEMSYDFFSSDGSGRSDLSSTLRDMYEAYGVRFRERKSLLDGTHPLVRAGLVEVSGDSDSLELTVAGQRIFLGEDFGIFGKQYTGLDRFSFAREVSEYVHGSAHETKSPKALDKLAEKIRLMEDSNGSLECLAKIKGLIAEEDIRALFYIVCNACAGGGSVSLNRELSSVYPIKERNAALKAFKEEKHKLQSLDLAEVVTESSLFGEYTVLKLTDKGRMLYFEEDAELFMEKPDKKELILSKEIKEKRLFFSGKEQEQLRLVGDTLQERNYQSLVARLEEKGLAKGIAVLLYGAPGTGKTESVLQWARESGRDVVHVDISAAKSMWYGESEKIVKDIFTRYKRLCRRSQIKPILLFNEADAIFSKRKAVGHGGSIDQTENTIQNIILEEMEKLEGILIATTNLADNLDRAFERRFLFKIRFERPSVEVKRSIWLDKLPGLSPDDAARLASEYDFSGGEIDNIVRKATMIEVLDGTPPSIETIASLCGEEKIGKDRIKIGFGGAKII